MANKINAIVPAGHGWFVLEPDYDQQERVYRLDRVPIIAWYVELDLDRMLESVKPLTVWDTWRSSNDILPILQRPDGRLLHLGCDNNITEEKALEILRDEYDIDDEEMPC